MPVDEETEKSSKETQTVVETKKNKRIQRDRNDGGEEQEIKTGDRGDGWRHFEETAQIHCCSLPPFHSVQPSFLQIFPSSPMYSHLTSPSIPLRPITGQWILSTVL